MQKNNIQDLFRRYLDNQCSPEEVKEVLTYFNDADNEATVRNLITETLENSVDAQDELDQWTSVSTETFEQIKMQMNTQKKERSPVIKMTWVRVAAAAILVLGAFSLYYLIDGKKEGDIVQAGDANHAMDGGHDKAVLTLSDGKTINLEIAANGTVTQEGTTSILKPANGQLIYKTAEEKPTEVLFNSIATPRGGQYLVILPDGSKAWLNAASSLRFPAAFVGKERKVELTGEAYFEVAKNPSMPFEVEVNDKLEVEVLGTHFNVNAYNDEPSINTTLLEGSVKVIGVAKRTSNVIVPGDVARMQSNGEIRIEHDANTEQAIAWKNGTFHFKNADLGTVLRQISRWYDVDVTFETGVVREKFSFSGELQRNLKLSQVLTLLEKQHVICRLEGNRVIVSQ